MRGFIQLWPLFLSLFSICVIATSPTTAKINPLQPFAALDIGSYVEEPSGLAFCNSTGHVYAISDSESSQYIYELDIDGSFITKWKFPSFVQDLEGVACDDTRGILYIIEEERRHVSSFILPTYDPQSHGENFLVPISDFSVTAMTNQGVDTGLEGITVDYTRDHLYVANEKGPKQLLTLTYDGEVLGSVYPQFGSDIGDICYDEVLDILWMVSDQSERLYAMDLTGTILYDYWDLDMRNAEGLAINHLHDPPIMYIATDPSATHGPPFVPAMFIFEKPKIGTGLLFYDPKNPKSNNQVVECTGCDVVWQEVKALEDDYYAKVSQLEIRFLLESAGLIAVFVVPVVIIVFIVFVVQLRKYNPALYSSASVSETELKSSTTNVGETDQWPEKKFQADFAILVV